ncbi:EAL domain-containing protein [Geminicoccaceae bacterium 1502E]|nr:EAL domain-containing protein [Geminicoccaceae bacterium 1502E]
MRRHWPVLLVSLLTAAWSAAAAVEAALAPLAPALCGGGWLPWSCLPLPMLWRIGLGVLLACLLGGGWLLAGRARLGPPAGRALATGAAVALLALAAGIAVEPLAACVLVLALLEAGARRRHQLPPPPLEGRELVAALPDAFLTFGEDGLVRWANAAARRLLGDELIGRRVDRYFPLLREFDRLAHVIADRRPLQCMAKHESSRDVPVEITIGATAQEGLCALRATDMSERHERQAELERLALHDALTGLPNRMLLHDRIEQALRQAERAGQSFAVMLLDLDRFKQVNDTLGHHVGDLLLQQVGPRLARPLRASDTLARIGGDEFAVVLPPPVDPAVACEIAGRLVEQLAEPFAIEGMRLEIGVSIGVALHPRHGPDAQALLEQADAAMYRAKRERLGFLLPEADEPQGRRPHNLRHELRDALAGEQFVLLYQPQLRSATRELAGVEVLIRWRHPTLGLLAPRDFLPVAEQIGILGQLTLWVLNNCLQEQRRWRHAGIDLPISVNLASSWLRDAEFPRILRLILAHWDARPDKLVLEVAESAIMADPVHTLPRLEAIAALGCELSLDDFGAGYSSLVHLQRLPVREIKIHRSFVAGMESDRNAAVVVRSIVRLAHGLGLRVVATGVETAAAADWLTALSCDQLQGYHFGRPIAAEAFERLLSAGAEPVPGGARQPALRGVGP